METPYMDLSLTIAGIIGPILIVLAISEYLNFDIWGDVHPTVVYLNGLLLLTVGMIIIRLHHQWTLDWKTLITLVGWLLALAGTIRMFFPKTPQLQKSVSTMGLLLFMLCLGIFLTAKAYLLS